MTVQLRIPRDPAFVGLARLLMARAARLAGVDDDRVEDVKIAVAEALATVAGSGDEFGDAEAPIELRCGVAGGGFEIVVEGLQRPHTDDGDLDHPGLDLLDPKLSFTLIEGLTDDFSHEPDGERLRLRFVVATGGAR